MSQYQRASYKWSELHPHVIISGAITYGAVIDFCREYYISDSNGHVVILYNEEPSLEMRRLLNHPFYRNRIYYIRGDITLLRDLKRIRSINATGLFLMNAQPIASSAEARAADTKVLMQSLKAKNWEAGIPIFVQIQDLGSLEMAQSCGSDRVICIQDLQISLMARNCLVPGMMTLVTNLINTYPDVSEDDDAEFWRQEYQNGVGNQVHSFRVPIGLVGVPFTIAAKLLYHEFNAMLFAVMSANAGINMNNVRLNPGSDYLLSESDIGLVIGDSNDVIVPLILYQYREKMDWEKMMGSNTNLEGIPEGSAIVKSARAPSEEFEEDDKLRLSTLTIDKKSHDKLQEGASRKSAFSFVPDKIKGHLILCGSGSVNLESLLHFIRTIRESNVNQAHAVSTINAHQDTPIVCIMEDINESDGTWSEITSLSNVYTIIGRPNEKKTLLEAGIGQCKRVIIFADQTTKDSVSTDSGSILTIKMIKKQWPSIPFLVEMIEGTNIRFFSREDYEWDSRNLKMQSVLNNYELQGSDRLGKYLQIRSESTDNSGFWVQIFRFLVGEPNMAAKSPSTRKSFKRLGNDDRAFKPLQDADEANDKLLPESKGTTDKGNNSGDTSISGQYFQKLLETVELNESGLSAYPMHQFDRHFAAGMVSISSSMHSLICQCYFRPYIIDVIKALSYSILHLRIPEPWSGRDFGDFYDYCLERGYIVVGLYRHGSRDGFERGDKFEIPFVYTNPKTSDVITSSDLAFAIKTSQTIDDTEVDNEPR